MYRCSKCHVGKDIDCEPEIEKEIDRIKILKLEIDSITGKEAIELTQKRNKD